MKFKVYQINTHRDTNNMIFINYENQNKEIDPSIYDMVYEGDTMATSLEEIYTMLNINHPEDYRGRSLSVSDVLYIAGNDEMAEGYYFCDSVGFKQIEFCVNSYVVCIDSSYIRDAQYFSANPDNDDVDNDDFWRDCGYPAFVNVVKASSRENAIQKAANEEGCNPNILYAIQVQ